MTDYKKLCERVRCVVPVSGGKDSQACLKLAVNQFAKDEIVALFCDTQFDHPKTYAHLETIESLYGVKITRVSDGDVTTRCLRYGRFPNGAARFCTDDLKIKPTKRFIENLAARQGEGFEVWYGMRGDESPDRAKRYAGKVDSDLYAPHEILPTKYPAHLFTMGVRFRLPILEWSTVEVMTYLEGTHNPLYNEGFNRVGCFPCLASGDKWKKKAFAHDETGKKHLKLVQIVEQRTGKSVFTTNPKDDTQGCLICSI